MSATEERRVWLEASSPIGLPVPIETWIEPLGPSALARVPKAQRAAHAKLATRAQACHRKIGELEAELEQARIDDDRLAVDAVTAGADVPEPRAPTLERELAQLRRAEQAMSSAIVDSANAMLASVADQLDDVRAELRADEASLYSDLDGLLDSFAARCQAIGTLAGEIAWTSLFLRDRNPSSRPWVGHRSSMPGRVDIMLAELRREVERVVHERERRAAAEQ